MTGRLHVALDARMPPKPSGVGIYTRELLRGLAALDTLRLTAIAAPGQPLPDNVERLATPVAFDAHGPAEVFEHVTLPGLLRARGVDVLHGPNTIIPLGRTPFARVVTIHDVAYQRFGETLPPLFRMLMRVRTGTAMRVADAVLAVSRFTARELAELYPRSAAKVVAVPSGTPEDTRAHVVDAARAESLLKGLGLSARGYACAIGTLEPRKNLPMLLEAFARAQPLGLKLALVGDRGWRDGPLRKALAKVPPNSVVLTGWLDSPAVRDLISQSAGLLYPSLYEGFGFPPLEALALGVPAACADLAPIRETCEGRVLLIDPLDLDGWVRALRQLARAERVERWLGRGFDEVARDTAELYARAHASLSQRR